LVNSNWDKKHSKLPITNHYLLNMPTLDTLLTLTEKFSGSDIITLHPERCLNTRFRALDCSLCADVCPAEGAITVANGKPALDNNACLRCGLCLHRCPTEAFTKFDGLSSNLAKIVAALPAGPVDLLCPQHPHPERGPASQAVQTQRCLAALSPVTLLELSTLKKEIWLDDTPCAGCPLGRVHPAIEKTITEANSWVALLEAADSILLRTEMQESPAAVQRPVYDAGRPPVSRRGLFGTFKQTGQEIAAAEEKVAMVKAGKSAPVSERLPQAIPPQRAKILSILEKFSPGQLPITNYQLSIINYQLPIANLRIDPTRCTACALCAKFCPTGALKFLSDGESFALTFQPALCLGPDCNICVLACPEQAIATQPLADAPTVFAKKSLAAGDLTSCQRCKQPIARGPNLPTTCFACRGSTNKSWLSYIQ
jgi:ferredoxin